MMPNWICCNSCFHPPTADHRLAVTTCGHIICQNCFQKGKQGECLICKAQCQVSPLSEKSRPEVQVLFSDVNTVAHKYLSEITKVLVFQMRHQKGLLSHYRQKSIKLEEAVNKMEQEMLQMHRKMEVQNAYIVKLDNACKQQSVRAAQQCSRISPSSITSKPMAPLKHVLFAYPMALSQPASTSCLVDQMDLDGQGLYRKPEISGSMPRLSLISPPLDGRMGNVHHQSVNQTSLVTHSSRSATVSRDKPYERSSYTQSALTSLSYKREAAWKTPTFNPPPPFHHSSLLSLPSLPTLSLQGYLPK